MNMSTDAEFKVETLAEKNKNTRKPVKTMFEYKTNGVRLVLLRWQKKDEEDVCPLVWRITYKRRTVNLYTGIAFSEAEWDDFRDRTLKKHRKQKDSLQKYYKNVLVKSIDYLVENGDFTLEAFRRDIRGGNKESVNDAFIARIKELEDSNSIGNASVYRSVYNALLIYSGYRKLKSNDKREKYIKEYLDRKYIRRGDNIFEIPDIEVSFSDITPKYLKDWESFLRDVNTSTSYIGINMRTLRAIINNEGSKPYLTGNKYPYGKGKYVIPTGRRRKTYITLGDVWKLEEYVTENLALVQARDMFVFMFYGSGMNFGDLCRLQFADIQHNMEISFFREKTAKDSGDEPVPVYVPLLPPMIEVINRQGNKNQAGYIFPFLNGIDPHKRNEAKIKKVINSETRKINNNLKVIANDLELDPDLSTNYARHSYMTHLLSEEYLNDIIVKQMVGHSTNDNVTAGYNHLTAKKRKEINEKLLNPAKDYKNSKIKFLA